jgi:phosphatidylglycerol---prolipoprotein diacylglyceryl transferase
MRPILFSLGSFPVYSYVVFAVLGYLAGLAWAWREARRLGYDPIYAADLSLVIFAFSFIGGRAMGVIVAYRQFLLHPLDAFKIWEGGFVYYGGLIGAVLASAVYCKLRRLPMGVWGDICAPTAMSTLVFGRIGCLLNGCCYGKAAPNLPWGIVYPPDHPVFRLGLGQVKVHPSPVYEALACLAIFLILAVLSRRKRFEGQVFFTMFILYSLARFGLEFFRGDPDRGRIAFLHLSISQAVAIGIVLTVGPYLAWRLRSSPRTSLLGPRTSPANEGAR